MLKRLMAALALATATTAASANSCGYWYGNACEMDNPQYAYYYTKVGPELTGDYSIKYLPSGETPAVHADPMYYHAGSVTARWKRTRPRSGGSVKPKVYRYVPRTSVVVTPVLPTDHSQ